MMPSELRTPHKIFQKYNTADIIQSIFKNKSQSEEFVSVPRIIKSRRKKN